MYMSRRLHSIRTVSKLILMKQRLLVLVSIIVVGVVILFVAKGATPSSSVEAENGLLSPAVQPATISQASKGVFVRFGATQNIAVVAPGAALPSDQTCASRVVHKPETRSKNALQNATLGHQNSLPAPFKSRVDGNYTGTTNDILQWAACKWGLSPDLALAQAVIESYWDQNARGDWTSNAAVCPPAHGLGVDGTAGQCPESYGILQVRYQYHGPPANLNTWPDAESSTAYNADYTYSVWRECYEGVDTWLNTLPATSPPAPVYTAGDAWGCIGLWYSGRWHTSAAEGYITAVKNALSTRQWEQPGF